MDGSTEISVDGISYSEGLGADFAPEATQDTTPQGTETAIPQPEQGGVPQEGQQPQEGQPGWNPEGPGDIREALRQEREAARRYQTEAAQYRAALEEQAYREQVAAHQARQEAMEVDALDPEAFAYQQQAVAALEERVEQATSQMRMEMSEAFARQAWPDYDATLATLGNIANHPEYKGFINLEAIMSSPNPAQTAYQLGKRFQHLDPAHLESEVQRRLGELAPRLTPQSPQAPRGLGTLPPAGPNTDDKGDPSRVSSAQLAKMSNDDRTDWYRKGLAGL